MGYLLLAYGILWALVFAYVGHLARRQARVDRDLERVRELLEAQERGQRAY